MKLLSNLCILYIVINDYEKAKQKNENVLEFIDSCKDLKVKKGLLEELIFIYYRFTSFESMGCLLYTSDAADD